MIKRTPFSYPTHALRRAAWTCALTGSPIQWNDPVPAPDEFTSTPTTCATGGRS